MSKYFIEDTTLTAIGDAVRAKAGTTELILVSELPAAIANIPTGGGGGGVELPDEAYKVTGNCQYRFAYSGWDWYVNLLGDQITTKDINNSPQMFYQSSLEYIPFDINVTNSCKDMNGMFQFARYLKEAPLIKGNLTPPTGDYSGVLNLTSLFSNCERLKEIPEDYFWNFGDEAFWEACRKYAGMNYRQSMFQACYSLRKLPDITMLKNGINSSYNSLYYQSCYNCTTLDEIINMPVIDSVALTSNNFNSTFSNTFRIKNMTFETNADGTPKIVNWNSQVVDLTTAGYLVGTTYQYLILNYNSGITVDNCVMNDEQYQALKDDPDWYAYSVEYSRYNHDSAVATINSLPDCSAYGTNTIKFKGVAGSATDGGAINTLTEEEIAVAAAKGWTVTLV